MKVKIALGLKLNSCLYVPSTVEDSPSVAVPPMAARFSDAVSLSPTPPRDSDHRVQMPTTPTPSSSGLLLPRHSSKSSKDVPITWGRGGGGGRGRGHDDDDDDDNGDNKCIEIYAYELSEMEDLCNMLDDYEAWAKWKEIPFQSPTSDKSHERARINNASWAQDNTWTPGIRRNPSPRVDVSRQVATLFQAAEPDAFDDDEEVDSNQLDVAQSSSSSNNSHEDHFTGAVEVKTYAEVSAVPKSNSHDNFSILINLKAPITTARQHSDGAELGTVGPALSDCLLLHSTPSLPLRKMTENGRHEALQAVNSLSSNGGTNISEALRKGAKVMTDRINNRSRVHRSYTATHFYKIWKLQTTLASDKRKGTIEVGDLYAEEERDFLVTTDIPIYESSDEMSLLKVRCLYKHPISKNLVTLDSASDVRIQRPVVTGPLVVSMEVDKQRNRLRSAEAMAEARAAAERGDLTHAASVLENCRKQLKETVSARAGDRLCIALEAELREMQERMANRLVYETSGRAYVLSGLSSHSWQRATARGDSTDSSSLVQSYQTPSMVDMVNLSQTMVLGRPSPRPTIRPTRSFPARAQPR
ncbi:UNVERIFIED_CONTAM: hypothetical protein Scaly_0366300 [Sesamum calycinum]|uniref:VWA-Hint protein Vwaint domain-containing protein n=1 Tax=Sesamum calycinum TaxID=2727403 RepID=A0AAW2SC84_9LAMI